MLFLLAFRQSGRVEDLEDAITYHRQALTLRPPGHPSRSTSLNNLATALSTRFEQSGRVEDLEDAITYHRQALTLRPPGHPSRSTSLNNLATALSTRFQQSGRVEDLEDAIAYHRQALTLCPPGHPDRSTSLNNLATALSTRFQTVRQGGGFGRCDLIPPPSTHSPSSWPPSSFYRSTSLSNLAIALSTRFEQSHRMEDLEESFTLHEQAANDLSSSPRDRLAAAVTGQRGRGATTTSPSYALTQHRFKFSIIA
jgi:tetratricopeptide (TPR) repeat protein